MSHRISLSAKRFLKVGPIGQCLRGTFSGSRCVPRWRGKNPGSCGDKMEVKEVQEVKDKNMRQFNSGRLAGFFDVPLLGAQGSTLFPLLCVLLRDLRTCVLYWRPKSRLRNQRFSPNF